MRVSKIPQKSYPQLEKITRRVQKISIVFCCYFSLISLNLVPRSSNFAPCRKARCTWFSQRPDSAMAKILSLEEFRARTLSSGRLQNSKATSVERRAAELMAEAAALLLESSPGNIKVAWMLQDLGDLLVADPIKGLAISSDENVSRIDGRDVLTNLG